MISLQNYTDVQVFSDILAAFIDQRQNLGKIFEKFNDQEFITKENAEVKYAKFVKKTIRKIDPDFFQNFLLNELKMDEDTISYNELKNRLKNYINNSVENYASLFGIDVIEHKYKINKDLIPGDFDPLEVKRIQKAIDCHSFVFATIGLPGKYWFYDPATESDENPIRNKPFFEVMENLGYLPFVGEPQKGDLIIYMYPSKHPKHLGIFQDSQTVISKWGQDYPQIFAHPILCTPYGDYYCVLRKAN